MEIKMNKNLLKSFLLVLTVVLLFASTINVTLAAPQPAPLAAPAGPPARPPAGPAPDASLAVHNLTYAPSPLDNPIKGFAPFFFHATNYEQKPLLHSTIWSYFAVSEVQNHATD